jgi:hypothetical protein
LPFIDFYFKTRYALELNGKVHRDGKTALRKLRTCVMMVIAIKRMENGAKEVNGGGLCRYVEKAIKFKGRIDDLNTHLTNLL